MCCVNAVLQLLVNSPPFWNLFRGLEDLKGQRGAGSLEISSGKTPLVDAMVRFFEEFMYKEKEPPSIQQPPEQDAGGKPRKNEEEKKENRVVDSFEPTYMYDAMNEKRQLMKFLVRSRAQDAPFCY
jgi:ubiquitin carboxyl-terminal hydrolase 10